MKWDRRDGRIARRRLVFNSSRSSSSLDRAVAGANSHRHGSGGGGRSKGQKIAFSRKFPFMKSRERLNRLDDDEDDMNGDDDSNG